MPASYWAPVSIRGSRQSIRTSSSGAKTRKTPFVHWRSCGRAGRGAAGRGARRRRFGHRIKQLCGQVLRHGVAIGWSERDVTPDLKGALIAVPRTNFAAITEPKDLAVLLRAIHAYNGHIVAVSALKLTPLLFVRPGELRAAE